MILLLGPTYALLDPSYAAIPDRPTTERVRHILICLGGSRQVDAILAALAAVDRVLDGCVVDVAAGPFIAGALAAATGSTRNRVVIHRDRFGLRSLMLQADVAISGAGMTLLELAATATPVVAVALADNQRLNLEAFGRASAALAVAPVSERDLSRAIEAGIARLAGDSALRVAMGARGRALVDGQGAARVMRVIGQPAVRPR